MGTFFSNWGARRAMSAPMGGEAYIQFADPAVEAICVANWSSDGIGLTMQDAAAVTNNQFGTTFQNNTDVVSFDELRYFTGLTQLNRNAFDGASALVSITIPANILIEQYAFRNNTSLSTITFLGPVTGRGNLFYIGGGGVSRINISSVADWLNSTFNSGNVPNNNYSANGVHLYLNGSSVELTAIVIPSTSISIRDYAFAKCIGITSITIPSSVTSIGAYAFNGCSGLTGTLTIPSSVTSIGEGAFRYCTGLTGLIVPSSITSFGSNLFSNCTGLKNVYIYNSIPKSVLVSSQGVQTVGDGTGVLYVSGDMIHRPGDSYYDFKQIIIGGNLTLADYGNRYFNESSYTEDIRIGGSLAYSNGTWNYLAKCDNLKFLEINGNIGDMSNEQPLLYNCYTGAILHLGKSGVACPPDKIIRSAEASKLQSIYVGDGTNDAAVLAQYQADPDWQANATMLNKLAKWSDYNGEYKTPPTIPPPPTT